MWSEKEINNWYNQQPWLVGFNYVSSTAVNSTEMWQEESFDKETIKCEILAAKMLGYNTCRVFFPFIVWKNQHDSFLYNVEQFLEITNSNNISVVPILFDDCSFSGKEPYMGIQDAPVKGIHNSGWTPSPGVTIADNKKFALQLEKYVKEIVGKYGTDKRILLWDLYNEPGNNNRENKCEELLKKSFKWARECNPMQPLTSGVWIWRDFDLECVKLSDIISYHDYTELGTTQIRVQGLQKYNRPLLCTEWLHRNANNRIETHLEYYKSNKIGIYNWGLVTGKTQTNLSWIPEENNKNGQPAEWQHDILNNDLTPYKTCEIDLIRKLTATP